MGLLHPETVAETLEKRVTMMLDDFIGEHWATRPPRACLAFQFDELDEALLFRVLVERRMRRSWLAARDEIRSTVFECRGVQIEITCQQVKVLKGGGVGGVGNMINVRDFAVTA